MKNSDPPVERYLSAVRAQIRNKRARSWAADELADHIENQRQAFLDAGDSEEEATEKALKEMGDPVEAGTQLDRVHRPAPIKAPAILTAALLLCGLLAQMILIRFFPDPEPFSVASALLSAALGLLPAAVFLFADYTKLLKRPFLLFWMGMGLYWLLHLTDGYAEGSGNGYAPSASALLLAVIFYAAIIYEGRRMGIGGFLLALLHLGAFIWIPSIFPDRPSSWIFFCAGLSGLLLLAALWKGWPGLPRHWGIGVLLLLSLPVAALSTSLFRRFFSALRLMFPALVTADDPQNWLLFCTQEILRGAKLVGSVQTPYFSELFHRANVCRNRLLLFVAGKYGILPMLLAVLLFAAWLYLLWRKTLRLQNGLGKLLALACCGTLSLQFTAYLLYNLGFPLFQPAGLPFVSGFYTSFFQWGITAGILLSVLRNQYTVRETGCPVRPTPALKIGWRT